MAKLTRKQTAQLKNVVGHLTRALEYMQRNDIAVAHKCQSATTTLHYVRPDGSALYEVDKDYGSNLTGLEMGLRALESFIRGPEQEQD